MDKPTEAKGTVMITGHGGNVFEWAKKLKCRPEEIIDMSSNINPLGPMPGLIEHLRHTISALEMLPEADAGTVVENFATTYHLQANTVLAGNGTTEFIHCLPLALQPRRTLILGPTYADYADACNAQNIPFTWMMSTEANRFQPDLSQLAENLPNADLVFICNTNNPTGTRIPAENLAQLCRRHPSCLFVIDESYLPFAPQPSAGSMLGKPLPNLVVLFSMSKIFKIPGLRLGFLVGPPEVIRKLQKYQLPWCVNALAQVAGNFILRQPAMVDTFVKKTRSYVAKEMSALVSGLIDRCHLQVFPGDAPFLLVKLPTQLRAPEVCNILGQRKILVRDCSNFRGLSDRFIRISLKSPEANATVVNLLNALCNQAPALSPTPFPREVIN